MCSNHGSLQLSGRSQDRADLNDSRNSAAKPVRLRPLCVRALRRHQNDCLQPDGYAKFAIPDGAKAKATTLLKLTSKVTGKVWIHPVTNLREKAVIAGSAQISANGILVLGATKSPKNLPVWGNFLTHTRARARLSYPNRFNAVGYLSCYCRLQAVDSAPEVRQSLGTTAWKAYI